MASLSETSGPCPDWILSNNSDVHRSWFTTYTPFETFATTFLKGDKLKAIGVGDVEISVKRFPKRGGPKAHGKLRLSNVLHVPTVRCNIIGGPHTGDYANLELWGYGDSGQDGQITDSAGRRLGYLASGAHGISLWFLKLSGPPTGPAVGESLLDPNAQHMIHAFWPESERRRFAAAQSAPAQGDGSAEKGRNQESKVDLSAPYSKEEKDWLKEEWGGEFKFLASQGLSIYKEDDREEGRGIVRAMMDEDDVVSDGAKGEDSGSELSLEGHFADYNFTDEELDFIEGGWGNTERFMLSFGLKFYNDEDCEEAKAIVAALMQEDTDDDDAEFSGGEEPAKPPPASGGLDKGETGESLGAELTLPWPHFSGPR